MKLIDDCWEKLHQLWSARLAILAAMLGLIGQGVEVLLNILPALNGAIDADVFRWLSIAAAGGSFVARAVKQPKLEVPDDGTKQ